MRLKGINLGGWLVLEKWITPSVFAGLKANDEYSFSQELGHKEAKARLDKHRTQFITEKDFAWLASNHIEIIRIPVGYWIFGKEKPFTGAIRYLDFAFKQAQKYNLQILICMHGAAGSQNGKHHSGRSGAINWQAPYNQKKTLQCLEKLALRYENSPNLWGIELLNEPDRGISKKVLREFYEKAYTIIRKNSGQQVNIIISDQFMTRRWIRGLGKGYHNVVVDKHLYQIFEKIDKKTSYKTKTLIVKTYWRAVLWLTQKFTPVIVGEWSAALPNNSKDKNQEYMHAQQTVFSKAAADFYWTYKTDKPGKWNYVSIKQEFDLLQSKNTMHKIFASKKPDMEAVLPYLLIGGGGLGLWAAITLMVDKIHLLKNPQALFPCDLNPIFSCGSVMESAQAEAFGFPNPIIGIAGFAVVITIGMAILAGAKFKRWFWLGLQAGTIFGAGFVHWLIYQSIYRIGALCLYCMLVWVVTIPIFLYVTIYNLERKNIKAGKTHKKITAFLIDHHVKILTSWYLMIIGLIFIQFWDFWSRFF